MTIATKTLRHFDALLEDARQAGRPLRAPSHRAAARPAAVPDVSFGSLLSGGGAAARTRRAAAMPASMLLHAAAAVAIVIAPLLIGESLPTAASGARAFFVDPILAPAPLPPPPPVPRGTAAPSRAPRVEPKAAAFTAPVDEPTDIAPESSIDLGVPGGVPGGVEGGVPGGVVGGIVTDLPQAPAPPAPVKAVRVGGDVREPRKIVDVPPVYPDLAIKARLEGIVIVEATIDERGRVRDAKVLRSVPVLDAAALEAVRQWQYTPTLLDGVPTPIVMTITVRFQLQAPRR